MKGCRAGVLAIGPLRNKLLAVFLCFVLLCLIDVWLCFASNVGLSLFTVQVIYRSCQIGCNRGQMCSDKSTFQGKIFSQEVSGYFRKTTPGLILHGCKSMVCAWQTCLQSRFFFPIKNLCCIMKGNQTIVTMDYWAAVLFQWHSFHYLALCFNTVDLK